MKYLLIISAVLLSSCFCGHVKHSLLGVFEIQPQDTLVFNYSKDQLIPFKHSNGYEFDIIVSEKKISEITFDNRCVECCDQSYYILYEQVIELKSEYPSLNIYINSSSSSYEDYYQQSNTPHQISINDNFSGYMKTDSLGQVIIDEYITTIDTLNLFGKSYMTVFKIEVSPEYSRNENNLIAYPIAVYYSENKIIKIEMDNGEYYGIL